MQYHPALTQTKPETQHPLKKARSTASSSSSAMIASNAGPHKPAPSIEPTEPLSPEFEPTQPYPPPNGTQTTTPTRFTQKRSTSVVSSDVAAQSQSHPHLHPQKTSSQPPQTPFPSFTDLGFSPHSTIHEFGSHPIHNYAPPVNFSILVNAQKPVSKKFVVVVSANDLISELMKKITTMIEKRYAIKVLFPLAAMGVDDGFDDE